MATNSSIILRLLASSVTVASRAGQIIKDVMSQGDLGIVDKGSGGNKNDLQTEADRSAQRCIVASLSKQFPDVVIIGEEGELSESEKIPNDWLVTDSDTNILKAICPDQFTEVPPQDIVVWVDPLDGTSEYTQGLLDHVTVLIGIAVKGKAVGGVIHQPYFNYQTVKDTKGRTIWGLVGLGIGGISITDPPSDKFIVTTTRSHSDPIVQQALDVLKPDEIIRVGGAGHKVLLLLVGKAHAYVYARSGCKKWDTCAPEGVLVAAGGQLTDVHGNNYSYHKDVEHIDAQGVFATARGLDHQGLIAKLPKELKDRLPY